jgi:hypothetical protein
MSKTNNQFLQMLQRIRAHAISKGQDRNYSTFRIIWTIYKHEQRCAECQRLRRQADNQQASPLGVTTR